MKRTILFLLVLVCAVFAWRLSISTDVPVKAAAVSPSATPPADASQANRTEPVTVSAAPSISKRPGPATGVTAAAPNAKSQGNVRPAPAPQPLPPPPGFPPPFPLGEGFVPPGTVPAGFEPYRAPRWPFSKQEARLRRNLPDREIEDAVKSVRPPNFAPYVVGAVPYVPGAESAPLSGQTGAAPGAEVTSQLPPLERLTGRFEGEVQLDQSGKALQLVLDIDGKIEEKRWIGRGLVELNDGAKLISRKEQKGELSLLRRIDGDSAAVLVSPSDAHQFQLYYLKERDAFAGNYYTRSPAGKLEAKGTVRLGRRQAHTDSTEKKSLPSG